MSSSIVYNQQLQSITNNFYDAIHSIHSNQQGKNRQATPSNWAAWTASFVVSSRRRAGADEEFRQKNVYFTRERVHSTGKNRS
jgi:hypothetical protein